MVKQAILVAALLSSSAARAALPDDALVDDGSKKLQAHDLDGALAAFAEAKKKAPRDPRPHYLSGAALAQKHDANGAENAFRAALGIDPKLAEVRNELATLYMDLGRNREAMVELKITLANKPDLSEGWYNLGKVALREKQCPTAVDALTHAAKLAPSDADTFVDLSSAQRKCNQPNPALASARQAVKLAARNPDTHLNLAFCLDGAGKLDDAASEATIATRLASSSATAWWTLGTIEHKRKRYDQAISAMEKARELKPAAAISDDIGLVLRDKGDLAAATLRFKEALAANARYVPARWHLAETLVAQHKCADVQHELAQLPAADARSEAGQKLRAACK